ncbi:hypothetical protein E2542_SST23604 [Spatholobus suberectus]|nr:hypothetical protein E2542_SST23604 [Spatholobus suberectus]
MPPQPLKLFHPKSLHLSTVLPLAFASTLNASAAECHLAESFISSEKRIGERSTVYVDCINLPELICLLAFIDQEGIVAKSAPFIA